MKKFPEGMMIISLLIGYLVNTFIPQALEVGRFTTGLSEVGTSTLVGLFILYSGATINFKQATLLLYKRAVLTILEYTTGVLPGLGLNRLFGPMGILGLTPLVVTAAITNSNGTIYTTLVKEFGDNTDVGAIAILSLDNGPFLTMTALGTTSLAGTPIPSLVAVMVPLTTGMILGNLGEDFKTLLSNGLAMLLSFSGFVLEANTSLFTITKAGAGDIVLGLTTVLFTGVLTYCLYSLIQRRPDPIGMAIGTAGGNAVAVPASVTMADPSLEPVVGMATAQVTGAVVIIAILAPVLTRFFARRTARRQQRS